MKRLLVLLAGQSNMAGRDYAERTDITPIPHLIMMAKDKKWRPAVEPITRDRPFVGIFDLKGNRVENDDPWYALPLDESRLRARGVGPGRTFGRMLLEANPGCEVGLLPMAVGGTCIQSWMPASPDVTDPRIFPYDEAISTAQEAQKSGELVAILWHQGENDAACRNVHYKEMLRTVIQNFRRDLSLSAHVPFIMGELGDFYTSFSMDEVAKVNAAMHELSAEMENVQVVSSKGLVHQGDFLHFNHDSACELGRRYYEAYVRLIHS